MCFQLLNSFYFFSENADIAICRRTVEINTEAASRTIIQCIEVQSLVQFYDVPGNREIPGTSVIPPNSI